MIVNSQLFKSYLECPTKCWLRARAEPPSAANQYAAWVAEESESYFGHSLERLLAAFPESARAAAPPAPKQPNDVTWGVAFAANWNASDLESTLHAVVRQP